MKKIAIPKRKKKVVHSARITNETVAEHREHILAGGRRFKYPVQYAKHRLVINAIVVGVLAVLILVLVSWQQLYIAQNTNSFFYRLTSFIPVPVASVDGQLVHYSDYLLYYNGSAYYLRNSEQVNFSTKDGIRQQKHIMRESLNDAEADAYAQKLAPGLHITVSNKDISNVIDESRSSYGNISERTYNASALNILGWTAGEYRHIVHDKLIRQEVAYAIDTPAATAKDAVQKMIQEKSADFGAIATKLNKNSKTTIQVGTSGEVPLNNSDGGLSQAAAKLKVGQTSGAVKSTTGDGYYFIRLLSKDSAQLSYTYIKIPLTVFDNHISSLRKDHKIQEFIDVPAEKTVNE